MKSIAKSINSQIASAGGREIWIPLDRHAALGLREDGNGLKAICMLLGPRCKEAREIFELLKAYGAGGCSRIVVFKTKPKTTQIMGLLVDNANHVATVLGKLKARHFPEFVKNQSVTH